MFLTCLMSFCSVCLVASGIAIASLGMRELSVLRWLLCNVCLVGLSCLFRLFMPFVGYVL